MTWGGVGAFAFTVTALSVTFWIGYWQGWRRGQRTAIRELRGARAHYTRDWVEREILRVMENIRVAPLSRRHPTPTELQQFVRRMLSWLVPVTDAEAANADRATASLTRLQLTQDEIDALAEYAIGYPLEEADADEQRAFQSGLAKIQAEASDLMRLNMQVGNVE